MISSPAPKGVKSFFFQRFSVYGFRGHNIDPEKKPYCVERDLGNGKAPLKICVLLIGMYFKAVTCKRLINRARLLRSSLRQMSS